MDTTPPDFSAASESASTGQPVGQPAEARWRWVRAWLWAPLAFGGAIALAAQALEQLHRIIIDAFLDNSLIYGHQAELSSITTLTLPVAVTLAALGVALWAPGVTGRGTAGLRLLGALALEIGLIWLAPVVIAVITGQANTNVEPPDGKVQAYEIAAYAAQGLKGLLLGLTLAVALGVALPGIAPRVWPRRLYYWLAAGALTGLAAACFALLTPYTLLAATEIRLLAVGAPSCVAGSGPFCLGASLLDLARQLAPGPLIGAVVGAVIGGFLAPELARAPVAPVAEPARPGQRRSWISWAWRYALAGVVGALYAALVAGALAWLGARQGVGLSGLSDTHSLARLYITLDAAALLAPVVVIALVAARGWLARRLGARGARVLRWILVVLAAVSAISALVLDLWIQGVFFGGDFLGVLLAAFAFGVAFGLVWAPGWRIAGQAVDQGAAWRAGARAALSGWMGVAVPAAVLTGLIINSLVTYDATASGCHGLGCGGLVFAVYGGLISEGVYLIIYGLLAATAGGALGGILRAALRTA